MYQLGTKTMDLIKKEAKGKKYLKLNIGIVIGEQKFLKTFDENGEIEFENSVYEIGSITKTFTTSLLAKYVHENRIQLSDSISKYFQELDPDKYYPTIKRLATHTSAIQNINLAAGME